LLLGIGAAEEIEKGSSTQRCPVCGFTQADFKKAGRLGCSTCYATFTEALTALLKAMHKGTAHVGKVPQRAHRAGELTDKMRNLNESLQKAVAEENYESAASLRDQIKQLEGELAG
jgi:protein arginine kinase activator